MASVKKGQWVQFQYNRGPSKGKWTTGLVQKVWSRGRYVGVNIADDVTGKEYIGVSLHHIEPMGGSNPAH